MKRFTRRNNLVSYKINYRVVSYTVRIKKNNKRKK